MFSRTASNYYGIPHRLYREPSEILGDIAEVKRKINAVNSSLNIRDLVCDLLSSYAKACPEKWIAALGSIVDEAGETLEELNALGQTLDLLKLELEETKCALRI